MFAEGAQYFGPGGVHGGNQLCAVPAGKPHPDKSRAGRTDGPKAHSVPVNYAALIHNALSSNYLRLDKEVQQPALK